MTAFEDKLCIVCKNVIFYHVRRQLAYHSTLYIICILRIDNLQVTECRVPLNSTFTLHSTYILQINVST
ncbi:MAG: hypothetical protein ACI4B3_10730 [Prevotella sp.]